MKKTNSWFTLYPQNPQASNLSIAGGAVRLVTLLLLVGAVLGTLGILLAGLRPLQYMGGNAVWYLLDEMDDELLTVCLLWVGTILCGYAARVLRSKAELLAAQEQLPPAENG